MKAMTKTASITTGLVMGLVYIYGLMQPDDMIFLLISSNGFVNIGWLIVSVLSIYLCFTTYFNNLWQRLAYGALGGGLLAMGLSGVFIEQLNDPSHILFKPLNFVLAMGLGLIILSASIAYSHAPAIAVARASQLISRSWKKRFSAGSIINLMSNLIVKLYLNTNTRTRNQSRPLLPRAP